jgi:hypothetical protein
MNNSSGKSIPREGVIFNSVDNGSINIRSQKRSSVLLTQKSNMIGNSNHRKGIATIRYD